MSLQPQSRTIMKIIEVKIRIPQDVHVAVKQKAVEEGRSMNKQITQIIKESVGLVKVISQ